MKQMENYEPGKMRPVVRPAWLSGLVEEVAQLFEPLTDVARVGFESEQEEETWVVRMYLGMTEVVGGPLDGQLRPMSFDFDLHPMLGHFHDINELSWSVFPDGAEDVDEPQAYITLSGKFQENAVRFHIFAVPPGDLGPGMRIYPDGRFEPS